MLVSIRIKATHSMLEACGFTDPRHSTMRTYAHGDIRNREVAWWDADLDTGPHTHTVVCWSQAKVRAVDFKPQQVAAVRLCVCYAMSGTDLACGTTRPRMPCGVSP